MQLLLPKIPAGAFVLLLFVAGFSVRAAAVQALRDPARLHEYHTAPDAHEYDRLARSLAAGAGYRNPQGDPTSAWAPGFPLLLALIYQLFGVNYRAVYLTLCLLGAATCLISYLLGRLLGDELAGRLAGLLNVIYLPHVYFATVLLSENLFAPLAGLTVLGFVCFLRDRRFWPLVLSGTAAGAAALTRPFFLLAVLGLGVVAASAGEGKGWRRWLAAGIFMACAAAVLLPWTARNHRVHGSTVLISTSGGVTFHGAYNDRVAGDPLLWGGWVPPSSLPGFERIRAESRETVRERLHYAEGLDWARSHPLQTLWQMAARAVRFWLPETDTRNPKFMIVHGVSYLPVLLLILAALLLRAGRLAMLAPAWLPVHTVLLASLITAVLFWGSPRFRDGNTPLLVNYAAVGLSALAGKIRRTTTL